MKNAVGQTSAGYGSSMDIENLAGKPSIKHHTAEDITLEALMAAQAHMGHSTSLWNPMNSRYIFGVRHGIHIISLEATASHLKRAARVVESVASRGGIILFVGNRKGQRTCVVAASQMTGGCYLFTRWIPGTITNAQQLLERCDISPVTPDDRVIPGFREEIQEKLPVLKPDLVVCMNPHENKTLLRECASFIIPSIGVIDTDADPTTVTYPIPANDDSLRCIRLIAGVLGKAGERGRMARLESAKRGEELPYRPFDLMTIAFEGKEGYPVSPGGGEAGGGQQGRFGTTREVVDADEGRGKARPRTGQENGDGDGDDDGDFGDALSSDPEWMKKLLGKDK